MTLRVLHTVFALSRWQKRIIMMLADLLLIPLALWGSYAMRLGTLSPDLGDGVWLVGVAVLVSIPLFIRLGLYRAVIRFLGNQVIGSIFIGVSISAIVLALVTLFARLEGIPRSVFFIYWGTAFLLIGGSRYLVRRYYHLINNASQRIPVAIYGAGKSGVQLAQVLSHNTEFRPVIFLDDNQNLHKSFVAGLKVHSPDASSELMGRYKLKQVLLAMPSLSTNRRREIINTLEALPIHVRTIPEIDELVSGKSRIEEIREIEIDDLLGRLTVAPDPVLLGRCITGKNVLVTGAGGSIGSEICRQIVQEKPAKLVLFERSEYNLYKLEQELTGLVKDGSISLGLFSVLGSVGNESRLEKVLGDYQIETVYHAAAYKHVPLVENNPIEGVENNIIGTFLAATAAHNMSVKNFVLISTDKAVRPRNVMGASKRMAELAVQALAQKSESTIFSMVRFGNVLDSSGSVVPLFRKQIQARESVTVTHPDIIRYFMTIPEAAQLVIQAGAMAKGGEVFLLDMGEPVRIFDLAKKMIHLNGLEVKDELNPNGDISIKFTGLRPGEKLYEELLIDGSAKKTPHPRLYQTMEKSLSWNEYKTVINQLQKACEEQDKGSVDELLKKYVSGYSHEAQDRQDVAPLQCKLFNQRKRND